MIKKDLERRCIELEELLQQEQNSSEYWQVEYDDLLDLKEEESKENNLPFKEFEKNISKMSIADEVKIKDFLSKLFK